MRKKIPISLILLLLIISLSAQVGINITTPQGVFHIDPQGDTSGSTNTSDDVIIDANGNMGIGTITPTTKMDIRGKIRIADGNQQNGYVMTTDGNGFGKWASMSSTLKANMDGFSATGVNIPMTTANNSNVGAIKWFYTNTYLNIDPGKQMIAASFYSSIPNAQLLSTSIAFKVIYRLSTSSSSLIDPVFAMPQGGRQISGIGNSPNTAISYLGYWLIENTATVSQKYYLWVSVYFPATFNNASHYFDRLGASLWVENIVTSSPIDIL